MEVSVWCKGKASWRADGIYRVMKPTQIQVFLLIFLPFINLKQQPLLSKSIRNNVIKSELSWKLGWSIILSQIEYVWLIYVCLPFSSLSLALKTAISSELQTGLYIRLCDILARNPLSCGVFQRWNEFHLFNESAEVGHGWMLGLGTC